jgi:predicted amidohydrolase YtcJ
VTAESVLAVRAGAIRTLDAQRPEVESLAVRGGRVVAIGTVEDVRASVGAGAEWLDLRPCTILPGLTDSHIHLLEWALGGACPDLSATRTMREALERVAEAARSAAPGGWLEFKGWDPARRAQAELAELDAAAQGRAVALVAHDLHSAWLNSEAMRRLGLEAARSDPAGGVLERDGEGRLTGVLREGAVDCWYAGRPRPSAGECRAALLKGQEALHRVGVTAVHSVEAPDSFRGVEALERSGELRLRVLHHFPQQFLDALLECGIESGFGSEWLRVGGIKYFTDGALGSETAWMLEPYLGREDRGIRRLAPEQLRVDVERAARGGLAATVHAIGDAAVRMTLDVLEEVAAGGLAIPHRVEHMQCVQLDDVGRAARAGIVASMQPSHLLTDIPLAEARWGAERCRGAFAFRKLLESGTILAFGSDAPVEEADPREGFYAAVARRDRRGYPERGWFPEERLSGLEVLRAYTEGPARAAGDADRRGRLSVGYLADFAAWDTDLVTAGAERLRSAQVVATVVGSDIVLRGF